MADSLAIFYCRIYFVPMIFHEIRWNTAIFCWLNPHLVIFHCQVGTIKRYPVAPRAKAPLGSSESFGGNWPVLGLLLVWACWCIPRFQRYWGAWNRRPTSPHSSRLWTDCNDVTTTSMKRWLGLGWLSQCPNFSGEYSQITDYVLTSMLRW